MAKFQKAERRDFQLMPVVLPGAPKSPQAIDLSERTRRASGWNERCEPQRREGRKERKEDSQRFERNSFASFATFVFFAVRRSILLFRHRPAFWTSIRCGAKIVAADGTTWFFELCLRYFLLTKAILVISAECSKQRAVSEHAQSPPGQTKSGIAPMHIRVQPFQRFVDETDSHAFKTCGVIRSSDRSSGRMGFCRTHS